MSRDSFRALLRTLIDEALKDGWNLPDVQGELWNAGAELDERVPVPGFADDGDDPFA